MSADALYGVAAIISALAGLVAAWNSTHVRRQTKTKNGKSLAETTEQIAKAVVPPPDP